MVSNSSKTVGSRRSDHLYAGGRRKSTVRPMDPDSLINSVDEGPSAICADWVSWEHSRNSPVTLNTLIGPT